MLIERKMMHDIIELIPDTEVSKVYAIINAYLSIESEELLSESQTLRMYEGFLQIKNGECTTLEDYRQKRGLN